MNLTEYTAKLPAESRKLVEALSALVIKAVPDAEAAIKWGQPVFSRAMATRCGT
jgi:uncharacterized protein YdhG (YjbR/CyaY superfamily)